MAGRGRAVVEKRNWQPAMEWFTMRRISAGEIMLKAKWLWGVVLLVSSAVALLAPSAAGAAPASGDAGAGAVDAPTRAGDARADHARAGDAQAGDAQAGDAQVDNARMRAGDAGADARARPGDAQSGDARARDARARDAGDARADDVRASDVPAVDSTTRAGDAGAVDARTVDARTVDAPADDGSADDARARAGDARARARAGGVELDVQMGWEGLYRPGRWGPVLVTVADPAASAARPARTVRLEVLLSGSGEPMRIVQNLTLRLEPATYALYAPLADLAVLLRDQRGRIIAEWSTETGNYAALSLSPCGTEEILAVVGGRVPAGLANLPLDPTETAPGSPTPPTPTPLTLKAAGVSQRLLADCPQAYDGVDLLVLADAELVKMPAAQQQAIADWVRAGGRLLLWWSDSVVPDHSPLAALLPCAVGPVESAAITLAECEKLGLASRVERLAARKLTPHAGAQTLELAAGKIELVSGRAGLGGVGVLSVDASKLIFADREKAAAFWRPVAQRLIAPRGGKGQLTTLRSGDNYVPFYEDPSEWTRAAAMEQVVDRLGDVPGVGRFDFGTVLWVMLGLMIVVGPVDWFVLRRLGQQPWTWATTAGWIALLTLGALGIGQVWRSGELHFRTVELIDQADGQVVSATRIAGIYSPRTQGYVLEGPPRQWWEPASIDPPQYYGPSQVGPELRMAQDTRGQRPAPMTINIWSLRFLQSADGEPSQQRPVVEATLSWRGTGAGRRLSGTLRNLSEMPLKNVVIRAGERYFVLTRPEPLAPGPMARSGDHAENPIEPATEQEPAGGAGGAGAVGAVGAVGGAWGEKPRQIEPGQTITLEEAPLKQDLQLAGAREDEAGRYGGGGWRRNDALDFIRSMNRLGPRSAARAIGLLEGDRAACIFAESEAAGCPVKLLAESGEAAQEKHWRVVRAVVPVSAETEQR